MKRMKASQSRDGTSVTRLGELTQRLRRNFELAVLVSFGSLATLVVAGMAVYRFATGNLLGGMVNSAIVTAIVLVTIFALTSRKVQVASLVFVLIATAGCIASAVLLGRTGVLWSYVVLWINFLLVSRHLALPINLVLVIVLATQVSLFEDAQEHITYTVTALLVIGYGYIFSERFSAQRKLLEELASHDPLTGAGNRRLMRRQLQQAIMARDLAGQPSTLVIMDIDHFKNVNDDYGHEAGDSVLERFAAKVRTVMRSEDGFFRLGGEEFVLLLPGMSLDDAKKAVPGLHERLSGAIRGPAGPVHFSAGVAILRPQDDWSRWLARADHAMYEAKHAGRNRLHFAD
jgi:diguanylate cyclase (GGDEF)-like protein